MNELNSTPTRLLTATEAAALLNLKRSTFEYVRVSGAGPPFKRHRGRHLYALADLEAWQSTSACQRRVMRRSPSVRWLLVAAILAALTLLLAVYHWKRPLLIWNASPSVPIGLYRVTDRPPARGDLVVVRMPGRIARLADRRSYLSGSAYLLKPVVAVSGDRVCRLGAHVFIRHRFAVRAHANDRLARPMPVWQGCRTLGAGEWFLLANHSDSFDSRYFGPIDTAQIAGTAVRVWPAT